MDNLPAVINWDSELNGAKMLVKSGMFADIGTPEKALVLILLGRDMGLSAVQSLRHLSMIKGKPVLSADMQLGKFVEKGGSFKWLKLTDTEAHLWLRAPGSVEPHVSTFSIEDAKRAQLNNGDQYRKYPKAMMRSRAITQGLKDVGFILGAGMYAPGEQGDPVHIDEDTGEVLPGESREVTMAEKMIEADIQPTAGAVQALSNDSRESVTLTAQLIKEAVSKGNSSGALNVYMDAMGRDNTDDKVALKRMLKDTLAKDEAKALRVAYDEFCRGQIAKIPPVKMGAEPDIHDVRTHLANGDMDSAADLAKSLSDPAQRTLAEAEVLAAHKQMSHA